MGRGLNHGKNNFDFIVCHSSDIETDDTVVELFEQADKKLNGRIPNACILFLSIDYNHQLILDKINQKWDGIQLIGGTTDGELSSDLGFVEDSAVMILLVSDSVVFKASAGDLKSDEIEKVCKRLVEEATENLNTEPRLCLTIPGNIGTNNDKIVRSLSKALNNKVPVFGGTPGDQWRFKTQYQFSGKAVHTNAVTLLLFSGNLIFEYGVDSGWIPMGETGIVNKAEGNIIYEINSKSAVQFYKRSLGELNDPSGEFPLVILNEKDEIIYQRTPARILSDNSGGIVFLGEIPSGSKVQIATAERDNILEGTKRSIKMAIDKFPKDKIIKGCLFISCAGRKALLGTRTRDEMKIAEELIGDDVPKAGFYAYSEISPLKSDHAFSVLHNQTFVTILFGTNK